MEQVQCKGRCLDEKGVDEVFDRFDDLRDHVRKIVCGSRHLLKSFLEHRCFERAARGTKRNDNGELLKGRLYEAEIYTDVGMDGHLLRVFGTVVDKGGESGPERPRNCFELVFRR
jgi:hypothetical protein